MLGMLSLLFLKGNTKKTGGRAMRKIFTIFMVICLFAIPNAFALFGGPPTTGDDDDTTPRTTPGAEVDIIDSYTNRSSHNVYSFTENGIVSGSTGETRTSGINHSGKNFTNVVDIIAEWLGGGLKTISVDSNGRIWSSDDTELTNTSAQNFIYDLLGRLSGGDTSSSVSGNSGNDANGESLGEIDSSTVSTSIEVINGELHVTQQQTTGLNYEENDDGDMVLVSKSETTTDFTIGWVNGRLTVTSSTETVKTRDVDENGEFNGSYSVQINTKDNEYDDAGNLVNIRHSSEGASFTKGKDGQGDTYQVLAPTVYFGALATGEEPDALLADSGDTFYIYTTSGNGAVVLKVLHETWDATDGDDSGLLAQYFPDM